MHLNTNKILCFSICSKSTFPYPVQNTFMFYADYRNTFKAHQMTWHLPMTNYQDVFAMYICLDYASILFIYFTYYLTFIQYV